MSDKYNGWTNYETWNVNLWLTNEYQAYRWVSDFLMPKAKNDPWILADKIRRYVEFTPPAYSKAISGIVADLDNHSGERFPLSLVDWKEIALHWIENHYGYQLVFCAGRFIPLYPEDFDYSQYADKNTYSRE